ncbi:lipopolysaccharide assembly protein LapA domain-containing protein [Pseudorhodoplanes sp.]|uniref:lipopolysaccharide assembly protein LapA domain-containing protein n=1 Tax=Pseudorhodoplanes sp. TaxID=1934341 RepID=UPI002C962368|nr:lipopolysaccharide assembly protein LapA domain-containing protein [Pseudorhodoplanes sp.]HWV53901.1 lipopolysaccharide assembly protein LapA domain-containing protein [Pseudorhodoplanes sp.]
MLRKLVFWLILVPLAIVILMFAVANRELVTVSFDPFDPTAPAASVSVPLFVLVFVLVIAGVIIGGVAAWLRQSDYRRAARRRDADVMALRREIEVLNSKLGDKFDAPAADHTARLAYRRPANG